MDQRIAAATPETSDGDAFVLILEDSRAEGFTLTQLCRALGVKAVHLDQTTHAAAILDQLRPSAVITDIAMPGHSGFDIMGFVAAMDPDLPVMVATSSEELLFRAAGEMREAVQLRNVAFVRKPVSAYDLRSFLDDAGLVPAATAA